LKLQRSHTLVVSNGRRKRKRKYERKLRRKVQKQARLQANTAPDVRPSAPRSKNATTLKTRRIREPF